MKRIAGTSRLVAGLVCAVFVLWLAVAAVAATYPYDTTCMENVNLRQKANSTSTILKRIQAGDTITVLGVSGSYYQVKFAGVTGYAMKQYVDGTSSGAEATPEVPSELSAPSAINSYPYDTYTLDSVKLRQTASDKAAVLLTIPKDAVVTVYDVTGGFAKVKYNGKTGYAMTAFLVLADFSNASTSGAKATATPSPGEEKYEKLMTGSTGVHVKALQEALIELKFYEGKVDSKFGAQTKTAVNAFKKKNGMTQDGIADSAMQLLLYEGKPKDAKGYRQIVKTLPQVPGVVIKSGSKGQQVETLQVRLKELGYYLGEVSGTCDKATVTAIKDFQTKHSIKSTGEVDLETENALYGATAMAASVVITPTPAPTVAPPKGNVRQGDKGADAKAVQQRLKDLGYYTGKVNGTFDAASVKALKDFQKKSNLSDDGVCGTVTRAILFGETALYAKATAIPIAPSTAAPLTPENTVIIKAGSRGNAVLELQKRLTELGYYSSRQDGVYLEDDISAVRAFQKANGLTVDGKAGYQTQSVLYSDTAVRGSLTNAGITLRYGSTGSEVTALQNRLIELGYLSGAADGKFGVGTKTALMAFQKANNLTRDGVAGAKTQEALYAVAAVKNKIDATSTLKEGTVSAAVKDLQSRLIALGYLTGTADGKFGAKTSLALIEFQKRNSLTADGIAGLKTLTALNSGTAKAAVGAVATPKPGAISLAGAPSAASVRYANWYTEIKARCRLYPNATIYDFVTGISWQVNMFSLGAHADAEPLTANDTANMNRAFGGVTTWTPKAVWVVLSDGTVYMASTHNTPHDTSHIAGNNFSGHICIHFPRTMEQVEAIGPYATSHQKAIDLGWQATLKRAN